jgi:hypothetical protein
MAAPRSPRIMSDENCIYQIKTLTSGYVRKGSKENRKRQVKKMLAVIKWILSHEKINSLDQLGKRQIVAFWQAHQNLSEKTRYNYWLALCELFELMGRSDTPPAPFSLKEDRPELLPGIQALLDNIHDTRLARRLSAKALAKLAGCRESAILDLTRHPGHVTLQDLSRILAALHLAIESRPTQSLDRETPAGGAG